MKKLIFFLLPLFPFSSSYAQDTIKNLIFEGAGVRGLAYAGAIQVLEKEGLLKDIEKIGGTSAGAIIATALSIGYTAKEIEDLIYLTKFNKFNQGLFGGFTRTISRFGFYKSKKFDKWLGEIIETKTGDADITFLELEQQGYINLYCVATLLDEQRYVVYSVEKFPNMKVRDAVRASMSIPMYFEAMFIDDQGNTYKKFKDCDSAHVVCDGGIIANFPIEIFDSINGAERIPNKQTLGFRIDTDHQIALDTTNQKIAPQKITSFKEYVSAFYNLTLETCNRNSLTEKDWERTVSISSGTVGPKIKKLSIDEKNMLLTNGKKGVETYFDK